MEKGTNSGNEQENDKLSSAERTNSSINKPVENNSIDSPKKTITLTDYSPVKGPKSISSFFAAPVMSPLASPSKLFVATKTEEDSGSDLIISDEEEIEKEAVSDAKIANVSSKLQEISIKPSHAREIPFSLKEEGESESEDADSEKDVNDSDSDISVVISLPSTDSNENNSTLKKISDYESEVVEEKEVEEPVPIVSESEEEHEKIPVMVFSSKQIIRSESPEAQTKPAPAEPSVPTEIQNPKVVEKDYAILMASIKQGIKEVEERRGKQFADGEIRKLIENLQPSVSKRPAEQAESETASKKIHPGPNEFADEFLRQRDAEKKMSIAASAPMPARAPISVTVPMPTSGPMSAPASAAPIINQNAPVIRHQHVRSQNQSGPIPAQIHQGPVFAFPQAPQNFVPNEPKIVDRVNVLTEPKTQIASIKSKTGFVYDERMLHHFDPHDPAHPEKPARISSIYEKLRVAKLLERSHRIPINVKLAEFAPEVQSVHDPKYCRMINQTSLIRSPEELHHFSSQFNSVYVNPSTAVSATVAAAATIELCQAIGRGDIENGFAIVRPPGHHAEHDEAMGFCIYNNVAVAASSLLRKKLASKILILDWDVHHGNGTQNIFAESPDVLYISLHRYDGAKFYPHVEEANCSYVGEGKDGLGKSVNVAWNGPGYGDADYLYAFSRLIMPIAREFNPDFVIVSAGFDAAAGDPIGECELTTFGYSTMLQELMTLAGGKVALVLEGGYNLEVISKCYEACVRTLLKEAPPSAPGPMIASPKAVFAVESTILCQSPYWKCLYPKPGHLSLDNVPKVPLTTILDNSWKEECHKTFNLSPIPGIFKGSSDSFIQKYSNRILASEGALFSPEVLIIFAHESGPIYSNSFVSSLCLQPGKVSQAQPFHALIQGIKDLSTNFSIIDINLPSRLWKLKQTSLGNEVESQELNVLFTLLWDRLISRSGCRNVFFVAAGSPIYAIGNLINTRDIESQVRGCYFFSSSLFIPIINSSSSRSIWYQRNSQVIVPSQEPVKKAIANAAPSFGSCYSAGQWLMSDSAAVVGDFQLEVLNFIQSRLQKTS